MTAKDGPGSETQKQSRKRRGLMEQEIYEQATHLFAQRGFAGTSFQDIADAVGLTRSALYYYVKSKDELLARLVREVTVVAATDIADVAQRTHETPTARLREIVLHMVHHQGDKGEQFRLLLRSEADLPDSIAGPYTDNRRAVLRSLSEVIEEGVASGEFRPVTPTVAALGLLGVVNWVSWWYHPGSHFELDAVSVELADMVIHSLAAEDGRLASTTPLDVVRSLRREIDRLEGLLAEKP